MLVTASYQLLVDLDEEQAVDSSSEQPAGPGRTASVPPAVRNPDGGNDRNRQAGDLKPNVSEPAIVASANPPQDKRYPRSTLQATGWDDLEIWLLSDFKVEIQIGQKLEVCNFADLGLQDRRTQKPNAAWLALRLLAEGKGNIPIAADARPWVKRGTSVQRLRAFLRHFFNLSEDPLPFAEGNGYRARFTIGRRPSYDS
jgi:hypothetical protein